eukprot:12408397-Alexandrium_andersonii.AAC.1
MLRDKPKTGPSDMLITTELSVRPEIAGPAQLRPKQKADAMGGRGRGAAAGGIRPQAGRGSLQLPPPGS